MAKIIRVDPNNLQPFPAIHRVLVLRGEMPLEEINSMASEALERLLVALVGSAIIEVGVDSDCHDYELNESTKGLLVAQGARLGVKSSSHNCVLAVFEARH